MKTACFRSFISIVLLLLVGCESKENFKPSMLSKNDGELQVYIIFSDYDQQVNSSVKEELMEHFHEHLLGDASIVTMYTQTEKIITEFNIEEFPTILVFNHKDILLQTTDLDECKEFIVQYYKSSE